MSNAIRAEKRRLTAALALRAETQAWFDKTMAEFVLEDHHVRLLTAAAQSWDRRLEARDGLAKHGLTFVDRFGQPHARPEVAIERDSTLSFARLIRELALDVEPPSESRPPVIRGRAGLRVAR
jgi:phage terminase small subunit